MVGSLNSNLYFFLILNISQRPIEDHFKVRLKITLHTTRAKKPIPLLSTYSSLGKDEGSMCTRGINEGYAQSLVTQMYMFAGHHLHTIHPYFSRRKGKFYHSVKIIL